MSLFFWIGVFLISLAVLIKAADCFTNSAGKVGRFFGLSPFIVGVTIVSIGTSLPELASCISAVLKGATEMVAGNVVGSNIANILLVVGLAAVLSKKGRLQVTRNLINLDLPLLAGGSIILMLMFLWDGKVTFWEGIIALAGYFVYLHYTLKHKERKEKEEEKAKKERLNLKIILGLVFGAIFIYYGANYAIESVVKISEILNIGTAVIALTAVAIGTSLPEIFVSISAARKGNDALALGNIFGSNLFNGFVVLGIPALITTLDVTPIILSVGIPFFIAATLLYIISGITRKIYKWEGAMYLLIYILFIAKLFNLF
jgi:cation:H+ antiporter